MVIYESVFSLYVYIALFLLNIFFWLYRMVNNRMNIYGLYASILLLLHFCHAMWLFTLTYGVCL